MAIIRIFTSAADLTAGAPASYTTSNIDGTRVATGYRFSNGFTAQVDHDPVAGNETWYHFRLSILGNANNPNFDTNIVEIYDGAGQRVARSDIINGRLRVSADGDSVVDSAQFLFSNNAQYSIDMHVVRNGTTDITVNWYINSAPQPSVSAANTGNKGLPERFQMEHFDGNNASDVVFSEGIIADEDTRGLRIRELTPQSFGVDVSWAGAVADVVDNDLGTGVSTDTDGARVSFGVSNLDEVSAGDIINRVVAQSYAQRGATGLTRFNHYFRYPDTTREDGPDITLTTTGEWYITEFLTNPKTTLPWVPLDLDGIQLGLRGQT